MRFTDDENRILELHVTGWCDVDITERVLGDMLMSTPELVLAVKDGVGSVSKGQGKKNEWNI